MRLAFWFYGAVFASSFASGLAYGVTGSAALSLLVFAACGFCWTSGVACVVYLRPENAQ